SPSKRCFAFTAFVFCSGGITPCARIGKQRCFSCTRQQQPRTGRSHSASVVAYPVNGLYLPVELGAYFLGLGFRDGVTAFSAGKTMGALRHGYSGSVQDAVMWIV